MVNWLDAGPLLDFRGCPMSVDFIKAEVPDIVSNIKFYLMINNCTLV